jgi:hypothetical protein
MDRMLELFRRQLPEAPRAADLQPPDDPTRRALERAGNSSPDWSGVRISPRTDPSLIRNCRLIPPVSIDLEAGDLELDGEAFTAGMDACTLRGCTVSGRVRLSDVGLLAGMAVLGPCAVVRCGRVEAGRDEDFGIGGTLELGLETEGRHLPLVPTLTPELACHLTSERGQVMRRDLDAHLRAMLMSLSPLGAVIGPGCLLRDTPAVTGCFLCGSVSLDAAAAVRESFLMGAEDRRTRVTDGALVRRSTLQWGARVDSMAVVERSLVGECATVERHGKLTGSLLGPDSCLGEGEITASLVGPFTAMHHQSLLIASRWPSGQGNVGYGANVGSNHTSRAPDQGLECGQGVFFGLGCSVKFPCSLERAPFSIVATGITTLPQRLEMPFSLLCAPTDRYPGVSPALNEIRPGWVIARNLSSLWRSMTKFSSRRRSVHTGGVYPVLSARNADMVERARSVLEQAGGEGPWTDIPGIGKNILTGRAREEGMEAYDLFLRWYALRAFAEALEHTREPVASLEEMAPADRAMLELYAGCTDPAQAAGSYLEVMEELRRRIRDSREKDAVRGSRISPEYQWAHRREDPVLQSADRSLEKARSMVGNHFPELRR